MQTAVKDGQCVEFHPLSSLSPSASFEFAISEGGTECLDVKDTYLLVRAKVMQADWISLAADVDVASVIDWPHTLFSRVDVSLNGTLISPSKNTYWYRAYVEATLK